MNIRVFAVSPIPGYNGRPIDRGQIIRFEECRNDQKLLEMNFFREFHSSQWSTAKCDECGARFITASHRDAHKRKIRCDVRQDITKVESAELLGIKSSIKESDVLPPESQGLTSYEKKY